MKKDIFLIFLLLQGICAEAQIRISGFSQSFSDGTASDVRTAREDPDGRLCAVLRIDTRVQGWTFDAGLSGITDTRYGNGVIWLYVPASARFLTVSHRDYGVLREWAFPLPLEPGRTYTMSLSYGRKKTPPAKPAATAISPSLPSSRVATLPLAVPPEKAFCQHFADAYVGAMCSLKGGQEFVLDGDTWVGLSYTWVGNRVGPYISVGSDLEGGWELIGGAAFRLTKPGTASLDWQLYGGVGIIDGSLGVDVGTRFGWRSSHRLSHWDFGFGCQLTCGSVMPTVSVGLYIWGIAAIVSLGVVAGCI